MAAVASGEAGLLVAGRSNHGPATEKFGEFRLRAKLLPSWASFLSWKRVGIRKIKQSKWCVFGRQTRGSHQGGGSCRNSIVPIQIHQLIHIHQLMDRQ